MSGASQSPRGCSPFVPRVSSNAFIYLSISISIYLYLLCDELGNSCKGQSRETFRVPFPMSKILDGVAWLAASLGSVLEDVVIIVVIILIINIGCHDRTEL